MAGCLSASSVVQADDQGNGALHTDWSTHLFGGIDMGWIGSWILKSATVKAGPQAVPYPMAGHTMVIDR